ncbi:MAG: DUF302 domain-containing protein [Rhodospirillum sp.]|nr:DUF302 domain-containing protein [Rhodospirillum sp.]MCF8503239.1 DUF302 domain-containing protein [Rhodospirillum sp.]
MTYHISTMYTGPGGFDEAVAAVTEALADNGFGIMTTIDVSATVKAKLDADLPPYLILGACNPGFALRAIHEEPLVGVMLPCNVVVRQLADGGIQVSAVDPVASMTAIDNPGLSHVASEVRDLLTRAVERVGGLEE